MGDRRTPPPSASLTQATLAWLLPPTLADSHTGPPIQRRWTLAQLRQALGENSRYVPMVELGAGGMGQVFRVLDQALDRKVAMKVTRFDLHDSPAWRDLLRKEAQVLASLDHPGIIPVHDVGTLEGGRLYFTMGEVRGVPLHTAVRRRPGADPFGWPVERVIAASQAVAHAHRRAVLHSDLKPENILVGDLGEVWVVDWGLGRRLSRSRRLPANPAQPFSVAGTPVYMSPEQARRDSTLTMASDVFCLGATLQQALTGRPPRTGGLKTIQKKAVAGILDPISPQVAVPAALADIVARATHPDPNRRYPHAGAFADALIQWRQGSQRHARALALTEDAHRLQQDILDRTARANLLRGQADSSLSQLGPNATDADKAPAWTRQDEADTLLTSVHTLRARWERSLQQAASLSPGLVEPRQLLSRHYRDRHAHAEARGDEATAQQLAYLLEAHDDGSWAAYLRGLGKVRVRTDQPVTAVLQRAVPHLRRIRYDSVQHFVLDVAFEAEVAHGSYRLQLQAAGDAPPVHLPLLVERATSTSGGHPGATDGILRVAEVADDAVYIPAGTTFVPSEGAAGSGWTRTWVDAFAIQRQPVTNAQWLDFLNDLVASGRAELAWEHVPRERRERPGVPGQPIYGMNRAGRFVLAPDADGDTWLPDWPVVMVNLRSMQAYADWRTARSGRRFRLPTSLEWTRAARGADRRRYVWGTDHFEPGWACTRAAGRGLMPVEDFPVDTSVFGVRGLTGHVLEVCDTPWGAAANPPRSIAETVATLGTDDEATQQWTGRGGHWGAPKGRTHIDYCGPVRTDVRGGFIGLRLVHEVD